MSKTYRRNDRFKKDRRDQNFKKSKKFKKFEAGPKGLTDRPRIDPDSLYDESLD